MPGNIPATPEEFQLHVVDALAEQRTMLSTVITTVNTLPAKIDEVEKESKQRDDELTIKQQSIEKKAAWFSGLGTAIGAFLGYFAGSSK